VNDPVAAVPYIRLIVVTYPKDSVVAIRADNANLLDLDCRLVGSGGYGVVVDNFFSSAKCARRHCFLWNLERSNNDVDRLLYVCHGGIPLMEAIVALLVIGIVRFGRADDEGVLGV
jgi:hypothetical protein